MLKIEKRQLSRERTFFGPAAVHIRASVGGALGILGQVVLSSPVKIITSVLGEATELFVLKSTHKICFREKHCFNMCWIQ